MNVAVGTGKAIPNGLTLALDRMSDDDFYNSIL